MDKLAAMATFVKVVETGSFTRAAIAMGLPKARISQRISDLERVLSVHLLHRTTRALSLTEDGSAYFTRSARPIRQPEDLQHHRWVGGFGIQRGKQLTWHLQSANQSVAVAGNSSLLVEDPDVTISACLTGAGICSGAPFAVENYVTSGLLQPVLPEWHFASRPIHIIYPTGKHLSVRVRSFVDWSFELMKTHPLLAMTPLELATSLS